MLTLRRGGPTSIFVHVRILVTETYEVHIQPAVPVSFGRSALSADPLQGDPRLPPHRVARARARPRRMAAPSDRAGRPGGAGPYDGLFSVRTVDVDEEAEGVRGIVEWLNGHAREWKPTAELVLDDVVVPFFNRFVLPIPVHLTAGIRRRVLDVTNPSPGLHVRRRPGPHPPPRRHRAERRVVLLPARCRMSSSTTASCRASPSSRPPRLRKTPA